MVGDPHLGGSILEWPLVSATPAAHDDSDAALVAAAQNGSSDAFGQLYQRYARMVHGILLAKVPIADVEDLVHDVFLRVLPRLRSLREPSQFGAWLAAIARNVANDYYRQPRVQNERNDDSLDTNLAAVPVEQSQHGEALQILMAIRSLSEAYRETLI